MDSSSFLSKRCLDASRSEVLLQIQLTNKILWKIIFTTLLYIYYFFSKSTVAVSWVVNVISSMVPLLLPYCCKPIYRFCMQNSSNLNAKMIFNLILFIIVEVLNLIFASAGYLVHLKAYQYIPFIGAVLVQKTILLVALYLLASGVAFITYDGKKVCHFFAKQIFIYHLHSI